MSLDFRSASSLPLSELAELFTAGYENYVVPFSVDEQQLRAMVSAYHLDLEASRVVYDDGEPVGLCNLGRRGDRGWIGGLGVVARMRGRGLGRLLMEAVHDEARARGVRTITLEVIVENTGAAALYAKLGYRRTRDLEVWTLAEGDTAAAEVPWAEAHARIRGRRDDREPWQRADETLAALDALRGLATDDGAAVARVADGRAQLLQVAGDERRLVAAAAAFGPLAALNLPAGGPAAEALRALGGSLAVRQHELALAL